MSDPVVYVLLAASCVAILIGALKLGGGIDLSLGGLWASPYARPDWPRRVQEADSPHFAVSHADALRRGTPIALIPVGLANDEGPQPEMVEIDDAEPSPVEAVRAGRPGH